MHHSILNTSASLLIFKPNWSLKKVLAKVERVQGKSIIWNVLERTLEKNISQEVSFSLKEDIEENKREVLRGKFSSLN